jgi:hypothetical protein
MGNTTDEELVEISPARKWKHMTSEEQRLELTTIRQSRYLRMLPRKLQRKIDQII